jgi:hypothetical protein
VIAEKAGYGNRLAKYRFYRSLPDEQEDPCAGFREMSGKTKTGPPPNTAIEILAM